MTGAGFAPGESVSVELHSTPVLLATLTANSSGAVAGTVTIPADTALGLHHIVLVGATSHVTVSLPITITSATGTTTVTSTVTSTTVAATAVLSVTAGRSNPSGAVASAPGSIAFTGSDSSSLLRVAVVMLVLGGLMLAVRRRRIHPVDP